MSSKAKETFKTWKEKCGVCVIVPGFLDCWELQAPDPGKQRSQKYSHKAEARYKWGPNVKEKRSYQDGQAVRSAGWPVPAGCWGNVPGQAQALLPVLMCSRVNGQDFELRDMSVKGSDGKTCSRGREWFLLWTKRPLSSRQVGQPMGASEPG